jgi:hypothetical protein
LAKRVLFLLFPFLLLADPPKQFHEATYKVGWDIHFSPYAGGEDVLFALRAAERIEGYFVGKGPVWCSKEPSARLWRFSELYMGWLPLNYLAMVAQHEVFGHGYRIRDINRGRAKVLGYNFNTPPPYGDGGAATHYDISDSLTLTEETSIAMAGVESTAILANLTKLKWLEAHRIDPRQTALYLLGQYDLTLYLGSLDLENDNLEGHDMHMYVQSLNYTYTNGTLSSSTLSALSWINLADPFTYYSIYAWFHYIVSGRETRIPMIPIYDLGYLPTVRMGLTPFGPEFFLENYLLSGKSPIYFYLKGGSHSQNEYTGLGFYAPRIWERKNWFVGFRFDAWRQPKLLLQQGNVPFMEIDFSEKPNPEDPIYSYADQHAVRLGAAGSIIIAYSKSSGCEFELGYKSQGFLPGYSLRASPTARLYYSLVF